MRFDSLKAIALLMALAVFIGCGKKQTGGREDDGKAGLARGGQGEGGDDQKKKPGDGGRRDRGREPEVVHVAAPQARGGGGGSVAGWVSSEKRILTAEQAYGYSTVRVSPDGHRVAVVSYQGRLFLDGKPVELPKGLQINIAAPIDFSGDSKRFAYIAYDPKDWKSKRVVLDGKPILPTKGVPEKAGPYWWYDGLALNHDGSAVVYRVQTSTSYPISFRLAVNDRLVDSPREANQFKKGLLPHMQSYPQPEAGYGMMALSVANKPRWASVWGEVRIDDVETVRGGWGPTFSRDGSAFGCFTYQGPFVNGKHYRSYPNMSSLVLSHDGKHFAHLIADRWAQWTQYHVSVDGKSYPLGTTQPTLTLSADAKRWAADGGDHVLTGDFDTPGKVYKIDRGPGPAEGAKVVLSEDHRHLAYRAARASGKQQAKGPPSTVAFLVRDGKKEQEHAYILGDPVLSRDGSRYAYVAVPQAGDRPVVYIDGKAGPKHDNVRLLGFTPDGTLFYLAKEDFTWRLVIEGKSRTVYDSLVQLDHNTGAGGHVSLNPDGTVTYVATRDGAMYLVTERRK